MSFLLKDFLPCEFLQTCLYDYEAWRTGLIAEIFIHIFSGNITMTSVLRPYNIWAVVEFIPVTEPFLPVNFLSRYQGMCSKAPRMRKLMTRNSPSHCSCGIKYAGKQHWYWSSKHSVLCFSCSSFSMAVRIQVEKFVRNFVINVASDYTLAMLVENCTREPSRVS